MPKAEHAAAATAEPQRVVEPPAPRSRLPGGESGILDHATMDRIATMLDGDWGPRAAYDQGFALGPHEDYAFEFAIILSSESLWHQHQQQC